ncbi:MAG TPA: SOS response-associated peptidase family protein [Flavisolibacter sp.]|jgi:putative SOS response-associated peptidase YedK|nr:SOS response-associated peptidase family protein [Flavisolibacter sp.]
MCYDISFSTRYELITTYVPDLIVDPQIRFDYETSVHVIAQAFLKKPIIYKEDDRYYMKEFEWGVIADYMKTPELIKKNRQWMCNAQSEKILDKKSAWHRIRKNRCLIPVAGFFEHREVKNIKNKIPYFIEMKDRPVFALIGLYNYAPVPDVETGEVRGTFTVITRKANTLMGQIHNGGPNAGRMPVLLPKDLELKWLQEDLSDGEIQEILDYEMPSKELLYHPVYTIRSAKERPDGKSKLEPFDWPGLPPLGNETNELSLFV